jgi:hypothetical protein
MEFMLSINFDIAQRLKYIYFTRYELLKFNNYFIRIAMFRRNFAYLFTKNKFLEVTFRELL